MAGCRYTQTLEKDERDLRELFGELENASQMMSSLSPESKYFPSPHLISKPLNPDSHSITIKREHEPDEKVQFQSQSQAHDVQIQHQDSDFEMAGTEFGIPLDPSPQPDSCNENSASNSRSKKRKLRCIEI